MESSSIIDMLFAALKSNTPWTILRPSFVLFESRAKLHGVKFQSWMLESRGAFSLSTLPTLEPGGAVIFASPNNPTGSLLPSDKLESLLSTYPETLFICDGAYEEYAPFSYTPLLKKFSNLLILRTFAKAFACAGIRLGYILGSEPYLKELRKFQLPFSCNHWSLVTLEKILSSKKILETQREYAKQISRKKDELYKSLKSYEHSGFFVLPSSANFLLMQWESLSECEIFYHKLKAQNILIRNLSGYGGMAGALRVTLGTDEQNQLFLQAFKQVISR